MASRDVVRHFRSGWREKGQMEAFLFVFADIPLPASDLLKLLELLVDKSLCADKEVHKLLCEAFRRLAGQARDKSLFLPYVRALRVADPVLRGVLVDLMPAVDNPDEHGKLGALLRSPDPMMRRGVARVLGRVGAEPTLRALAEMSGEPDFAGRSEAMEVAVGIAGSGAVGVIAAALGVGSETEKLKALDLLVEHVVGRDPISAMTALAKAIGDPEDRVAIRAVEAFSARCTEEDFARFVLPLLETERKPVVLAVLETLGRFEGAGARADLASLVRHGPPTVKTLALEVIEKCAAALPVLNELIQSEDETMRARAAEMLGQMCRDRRVDPAPTVIALLSSRDEAVRDAAVEMVRGFEDPAGELWPPILDHLRTCDWRLRERMIDALVRMAGRDLTAHLMTYLTDPSPAIRRYGIEVVARLGDPQATGALVRAAQRDSDWWVRECAVQAMARLGDARAVPYIVDLMRRDADIRLVCLEALGTLGDRSIARHVAAMLGVKDSDVREAALDCLGVIGDVELAPAVRPIIRDTNPGLALKARSLLTRWGAPAAVADEGLGSVDGANGGSLDGRTLDHLETTSVGVEMSSLDRILTRMLELDGDDLLLGVGRAPFIKVHGETTPLGSRNYNADMLADLLLPHLTRAQVSALEARREVDFSYVVRTTGRRFRAHVFAARGGLGAVFRALSESVPTPSALGLPESVVALVDRLRGLLLIAGPRGSGRSTTVAALVGHAHRTSARHVVCVADPIEYVHGGGEGLVTQREVGMHARSFDAALQAALRQDPDVVVVGALRDAATVRFAVAAAESGHLVLGTVEAPDSAAAIDRVIEAFPEADRSHARAMLADGLVAVISQMLLPRRDGHGRVPAIEVLLNGDAIAAIVRRGRADQIRRVIAAAGDHGMQSMDSDLQRLVEAGTITASHAYVRATDKTAFEGPLNREAAVDGGASSAA